MKSLPIADTLQDAIQALMRSGIDAPELDAELLLAHALGVNRTWLIAHSERVLTANEQVAFSALLARRLGREPLAYITGERWFYDFLLHVTPDVLIPRPETEELVERALAWLQLHPGVRVADIGTGSGAIALAVARHTSSDVIIFATDIDARALNVARKNAFRLHVSSRVIFRQGDLLTPLSGPVDLILANLPYVSEDDYASLMPEVRDFEPDSALFGGPSGLEHLSVFLAQAPDYLCADGAILAEMGYNQAREVTKLAREHFPDARIVVHKDLAGHDRILEIQS